MSKIIIFGNQKGGVGKTTLTCLCANALSQAPFNYKVCVIDNDKQKSIAEARNFDIEDRTAAAVPYTVLEFEIEELQQQIQALDKAYDLIFIDTAGKLDTQAAIENQEITKAIMYCDYLFLPFRAGNFNLDASLQYLKFLLEVQEVRSDSPRQLKIMGFVNMYRVRSKVNDLLISEIKHLKEGGVSFMVNRLGNYTIFEDVDTLNSMYDEDTNHTGKLNFTVWLNEFIKLISNG
ncbi:MAG: ParA family protein [Saprospiraceae bacterium]